MADEDLTAQMLPACLPHNGHHGTLASSTPRRRIQEDHPCDYPRATRQADHTCLTAAFDQLTDSHILRPSPITRISSRSELWFTVREPRLSHRGPCAITEVTALTAMPAASHTEPF